MKEIYKSKYMSIIDDDGYEIINEKNITLVLPIIHKNNKKYIGIRYEVCPAYSFKNNKIKHWYTVLSGGCEPNEETHKTALRELKEESGIIPKKYKIKKLKHNMPICKSTSMLADIYKIDIFNYDYEIPKGDGTIHEKLSKTIWIEEKKINKLYQKKNIDFLLFGLLNLYIN